MLSNVHARKAQTEQCCHSGCNEDRVCTHVRSDVNKIAPERKWCQPCRELIYMDNAPEAVSIGIYSTHCGAASTRAARFGEKS